MVSVLVQRGTNLQQENDELLIKMSGLCKDLDFQDDEIKRKGKLVENLLHEVSDIML